MITKYTVFGIFLLSMPGWSWELSLKKLGKVEFTPSTGWDKGELVDVSVVAAKDGFELSDISLTMPGHGHGMNTKAEIQRISPKSWAVKGVKFHMPGVWCLRAKFVDLNSGEKTSASTAFNVGIPRGDAEPRCGS